MRGAPAGSGKTHLVEIFRNAPDYVMVVWVHFVLPLLIGTLLHTRFELNPFVSAIIALGFVYSGYFAETFRAGIEAVPLGQIEAGRSCGMSDPHGGIVRSMTRCCTLSGNGA
jgi:polar amino acid transport system permease protein